MTNSKEATWGGLPEGAQFNFYPGEHLLCTQTCDGRDAVDVSLPSGVKMRVGQRAVGLLEFSKARGGDVLRISQETDQTVRVVVVSE